MDCDESLPEDETIQDVPKILSPELHDIFPIFASMLDIKSFMKLSMTSKETYKRCMEDKSIKINVNENELYGYGNDRFHLNSSVVSKKFTATYLSNLRKMRCTVNLQTFEIRNYQVKSSSMIDSARKYVSEIGVNRIEKLSIRCNFGEWDAAIPFIKDFHVNVLEIRDQRVRLSPPVLHSLLQLNLKEFSYNQPVPVDLLFEINTTIPKLSFRVDPITKEQFMQILWMIQSGALTHLTFNIEAVDWRGYGHLPFHHQGAIPDDRPLLFTRTPQRDEMFARTQIYEYWFLHWQGGVTKCVANTTSRTLEVFKCDPSDFPVALRKEEDVMKDLKEMRSGVSCHLMHFFFFSKGFTMLDRSLKGPLPTERPLFFEASETSFWRLDKNEVLMECRWKNGCVIWERTEMLSDYPALCKHMFWNFLKKNNFPHYCFRSISYAEFDSWFKNRKTFGYDYVGPLPDERPLVFGGDSESRLILFDGFSFVCESLYTRLFVKPCADWMSSTSEISAENIKEMLQDTLKHNRYAFVNIRVSLKTFRDGMKLFEAATYDSGPFLSKSTGQFDGILMDECWYSVDGAIMKVVWKEGRVIRTPGDLREFPLELTKTVFKELARQGECKMDSVLLDSKQFESCLEQFTVLPFENSGFLKSDSPLAFVKKEIRHTCDDDDSQCQCSDVIVHVRFLWEDVRSTHCSWGEKEQKKIVFKTIRDRRENIPVALKSKEYLKILLETSYDDCSTQYEWHGDINDFLSFFDGCKKFPFNHKGPLPKERPLVFEDDSDAKEPVRFYLREDDSVVKCKWSMISKRIGRVAFLSLPRSQRLNPPATREVWETFTVF